MDNTVLFLVLILTTTQTTTLHHPCNSDVYSLASGLQELTTLQYCLIDNCTIIRNDTGQQLDIVYTTQSHLVVNPTDGQTSTMLISKNDPELFCSPSNTTDNADLPITKVITVLLSSLLSACMVVLHLMFKELRNAFGKLMIIYNLASFFISFFVLIFVITHYTITVYSITLCYLIYFLFMQSIMITEGSATTCITAYFTYVMRQSCKCIEIKKVQNKQFYKNSIKYIFGSLLLLDILIFSYDFGTATFQHVILPNGHCSLYTETEYDAINIAYAYINLNKIIQIIFLVVFFIYNYKLNKILKTFRTAATNGDHQQNKMFFKLAASMAATIGTVHFFFAYTRLINSTKSDTIHAVGGISALIQRCAILLLFVSSKKVLQLCKDRFCTTGTS